MNAAFVRIKGKGPINHTATANFIAPARECRPNRAQTHAKTPQVRNGSGLVRAIAFASAPCRQTSGYV